jgi:hypothetical protein
MWLLSGKQESVGDLHGVLAVESTAAVVLGRDLR